METNSTFYMTLKKTELLGKSEYDEILQMHVYTLVWVKSDWIGFLIVGLNNLDYSTDSHITPACIRSIRLYLDFAFCTGPRFFSQGREPEVNGPRGVFPLKSPQARAPLCAFSLYNYHIHHIWNVQRCSFALLFVHHLSRMLRQFDVAGDVKRSAGGGSVTTSWNGYSTTYCTGV